MAGQGPSRGYEVTFVSEPPKEVETNCPICFHVFFEPKLAINCGHSFCATCIANHEEEEKPCPFCNQQGKFVEDKRLKRIINDYEVYCPHREKGCEWTGELRQLESHLNYRDPILDDVLKGCQFQEVQCGFCRSYRCERCFMPDHISTQCPNHEVECEYHYAGCEVKKLRHELEAHMRDSVTAHLSLVASFMQRSLSRKDSELEQLREELRQQRETSAVRLQETEQQHHELSLTMQQQHYELRKVKHQQKLHWILVLFLFLVATSLHAYLDANGVSISIEIKGINGKLENVSKQIEAVRNTSDETIEETVEDFRKQMEVCMQNTINDKKFEDVGKKIQEKVSIVNETINGQVEDVRKRMHADAECNKSKSSKLYVTGKQFQRMKREVQLLGERVDFPVLPVYLNLTCVKEHMKHGHQWLSMPFYTHKEGYKMRLIVYPNGTSARSKTHISVAVRLMYGKHDNSLDWPLNVTVNVTLLCNMYKLHFVSDLHITKTYKVSSLGHKNKVVGRVWNDTMAGSGAIESKFVQHDRLFLYTKHDTLYFRVETETSDEKGWFW